MPLGTSPGVKTLLRLWNSTKGMFGDQLVKRQNLPFQIALVGSDENRAWASERLGLDESFIKHYTNSKDKELKSEKLVLRLGDDDIRNDAEFKALALAMMVKNKNLRVAVASKSAPLRPIIVNMISQEWAAHNAKRAVLDALPGILPSLDFLLPFTGTGDMVALTRNQIEMVLEIAACHNLPPDPKARLTELVPVIGSAFGWRALARQLLTLAPFGTGVVISGALAYAGTLAVGKSVDYFYASGGKTLDLGATFTAISSDALGRAKEIVERMRPTKELTSSGTEPGA